MHESEGYQLNHFVNLGRIVYLLISLYLLQTVDTNLSVLFDCC
jgi:hypothetical protein